MRYLLAALPANPAAFLPAALLLFSGLCCAAESNPELRALTNADQRARTTKGVDWAVVAVEDRQRRARVHAMLAAGTVQSAEDYYNAALIMQHGDQPQDYRLAYSLATLSTTLDPESASFKPFYKSAKWLTAAAWDRLMMKLDKPQWYGTQFARPDITAPWQLYKIDEDAVSDDERKSLGVPTKAEALQKLREMNKG